MNLNEADIQLAAARHLRWMPSKIQVTSDEVVVEGWALSLWGRQDQTRFLVNGIDFDEVEWPLPSSHLLGPFSAVPHAENSLFRCRHPIRPGWDPYPGGFVRFSVTGQFGEHRRSYRTSWFAADPAIEPAMPSSARIERVIGADDAAMFRQGGATIAKRLEHLLLDRFGRAFASFDAILDWGCGSGRLARYLPAFSKSVTGADIDPDNIQWCGQTIAGATFRRIDPTPPTPFPDGSFDLVFGISVLTHLDEAMQNAWLDELRRIVRPGGILLLSIQGLAQMSLYRAPIELNMTTHQLGLYCRGTNNQLDEVLPGIESYKDVIHSHDYVMARWSAYFDVLEIVEAIAGNQDLVILRRRPA